MCQKVAPGARILCWLVEFAAYLLKRCDIGSDGQAPIYRLHGRRDNTPILEFEAKILYMSNQQREASGTCDSILQYSLEC